MKLMEKKMANRPFVSELFSLFPSSFRFTNLIDISNYNEVMKSEDKEFKKNIIDKGLQQIDNEFIALKNRQIVQKMHFTNTFKKRNMQLTANIADAFHCNTNRRREGVLKLKENLFVKTKPAGSIKHKSDNVLNILKSKVIADNEDESLSRGSDIEFNTAIPK